MDARQFLGLEPTAAADRWELPVVPGICTGGNFLFGGCALGAAIAALEGTTQRPVVWATGQYLSFAHPPEVLSVDVTIASDGRNTTQARAVGRVGAREILTVNAALGRRDFDAEGQWEAMPEVPPPDACPPRDLPLPTGGSILSRLDQRIVVEGPVASRPTAEHGRTLLWSRMPDLLEMSPAALAILGDYVPMGIARAIDRMGQVMSNSLDNTLRVVRIVPTDWVLVDIRVHALAGGFGHGLVHLWATDGTLLATASQSAITRHRRD